MESALKTSHAFTASILDSLTAHIAVLNAQGEIVHVNQSWIHFGQQNGLPSACQHLLGANYVQVCQASLDEMPENHAVAAGILAVLEGTQSHFYTEYPCHSPTETRWFSMAISPLQGETRGCVISHENITARKQMEQALCKREEQLKLVLEGGYLGFWDWNIVTGRVERNAIWAEMLGYSIEEIEYSVRQWADFIYPDDREKAWQSIDNALSGRTPYHEAEYRMVHKNGSIKWVLDHASVVQRDADGKPIRMSGTHTDITQLKAMEANLRTSETGFKNLFTHAPLGIALINSLTGSILQANQKYADILGLSVAALHNLTWMQLTYPADIQQHLDQVALMNTGQIKEFNLEKRCIHADGRLIWINVTVARLSLQSKNVHYHHCIIEDITERKRAETELKIAAAVFEAQEGMMITDAQGTILKVNHTFTEITGYSANEVIGKNPRLLSSGKHDKAFYRHLWRLIQDTGVWRGEVWNRRKNGQIYPQWMTITAVKTDKNQNVTHYVATLTDITERKAIEEQVNRLAFYDALTDLPNRRLLQKRLEAGIAAHRKIAVLMIDLDRFKAVNDTLGHTAGDKLLQQVAERIKQCLQKKDLAARLGGDEFVVLLENVQHYQSINRIAKSIIECLNAPFILGKTHTASIGTSIGIAIYPQHGQTVEDLMDNADAALYRAKDNGRGCFAYFSDDD